MYVYANKSKCVHINHIPMHVRIHIHINFNDSIYVKSNIDIHFHTSISINVNVNIDADSKNEKEFIAPKTQDVSENLNGFCRQSLTKTGFARISHACESAWHLAS